MGARYRLILLSILTLTTVWFVIIFLCLPRDNSVEHWPPVSLHVSSKTSGPQDFITTHVDRNLDQGHEQIQPPHSLDSIADQNSEKWTLDTRETLLYGFDPDPLSIRNGSQTVSKDQHHELTLELGSVNNSTDQYVKSRGDKLFAYNLLVSNRIGLFRPIPDTRNAKCLESNASKQAADLSSETTAKFSSLRLKSSIIICYYNEAPSALLRTIYTILRRSPLRLLSEIIIVDDSSDDEFSSDAMKSLIKTDLVTIVRTSRREGLIRARLFGAKLAKGDVLIFLDSHIEANVGWLEPLIEIVQENKTTIACPMIDPINPETLVYTGSPMVKGGLSWDLHFKWDAVPSDKLKTYDDFIKPIDTPTMAGGLFAIDRKFFYDLGAYDEGMELWGGENIELSLRTWMCGGRIVILPCSRMGHIFRKTRPYGPEPGQPDCLLVNSNRAARVWLDDHLYKFYEASPEARYLVQNDVSQRLELKQRLGCQNFSWFLDNIYPSLRNEDVSLSKPTSSLKPEYKLFNLRPSRGAFAKRHVHGPVVPTKRSGTINTRMQRQVPDPHLPPPSKYIFHRSASFNKLAQFQIQLSNTNFCIEANGGFLAKGFTRLILNHCAKLEKNNDGEVLIYNSTILNQLWTETEFYDFRLGDNNCLDLIKKLPLIRKCHNMGSFQAWTTANVSTNESDTSDTTIYNIGSGLCLGVEKEQVGDPIIVTICENQSTNIFGNHSSLHKINKRKHRVRLTVHDEKFDPELLGASKMLNQFHGALQPSQRWRLLFANSTIKL